MVDITIDNYEAYFLDFVEGNLSEAEQRAVKQFVEHHPELKEELEGFEVISLADSQIQTADWSNLKKTESDIRENLYFKAVENDVSQSEKKALENLLRNEANERDFKVWQQTRVAHQGETLSKSELYQLGFDLPIAQHNYEHFLIGFAEGILDPHQTEALLAYAHEQTRGERDLKLASSLKLKPAKGIFYPDKKSLYKKERRVALWWYQAAAVAVLLVLIAFLFNVVNRDSVETQVAEKPKNELPSKSLQANEADSSVTPSLNPEEAENSKADSDLDYNQNIALGTPQDGPIEKEIETEARKPQQYEEAIILETIAVKSVDTIPVNEMEQPIERKEVNMEEMAHTSPAKIDSQATFKTLPQLAEDAIANRFDIKDDERDEMALVLARRVSEKAAEMLDTEMSKESSDNGDNMTYTFRFRNFKVQHSRNR